MSNNIQSYDLWEEVHNPPKLFFEDEVRDGFLVSTMMKRFWAAQMKVLAEIDRICKRHSLNWYAAYGTLIGAVRHGGFIPWDDDMDICMLREDYVEFLKYAPEELPEGYDILTLQLKDDYESFGGRVINTYNINYTDEHLESHFGCPYLVGIDIFPLDGILDDHDEEDKRDSQIREVAIAQYYVENDKTDSDECKKLLAKIEKEHNVKFKRGEGFKHELMLLCDSLYSVVPTGNTKDIAMMTNWISHGGGRCAKKWYEKTVYLPFEYVHLPVPAYYENVIWMDYGSYMTIVKGGGAHNYPLYSGQENILKDQIGCNPYRYTMPETPREPRNIPSVGDRCAELTEMLKQVSAKVVQLHATRAYDAAEQLLSGSITLIDSLERILNERDRYRIATTDIISEYRNLVADYNGERHIEEDLECIERADAVVNRLLSAIESTAKRKEILFLPVKAEWWYTMEPEWRLAKEDENNDVYVMPLLYLEKDFVQENGEEKNDGDLLPSYVERTTIEEYDIAKHHPDVVYIQDPYDGDNTMIAVPSYFYSENLLKHTDKLVYLPCYDVDNPESEDDRITSALRIIVEQPAVYFSDKVIVRSEELRQVYLNILATLTGEETRAHWEAKVSASQAVHYFGCNDEDEIRSKAKRDFLKHYGRESEAEKKLLLMQINIAFILQNGMKAIDKINDAIELIREQNASVICAISLHESLEQLEDIIKDLNPALLTEYQFLVNEIKNDSYIVYDSDRLLDNADPAFADAYYGTTGALGHRCMIHNMPTMFMGECR